MSKPTKQRATIVDKHSFCFTHLNLRFPLTPRRVCSPFFSFQTHWRWMAETTAKWENDYTGRKKDQNQSGSGCFSAVPEEPGNFLVLLPRWLEATPAGAVGISFEGGRGWRLGCWTGGVCRELVSLNVSNEHFKLHSHAPSQCGVPVLFEIFANNHLVSPITPSFCYGVCMAHYFVG